MRLGCHAAALSLSLALASIARAHDPGLSSITVSQRASRGHFSVVVHDAELPERRRARSAACSADGVLSVSVAGRPLGVEAACRAHDPEHTAFEGTFDASVSGPLALELTLLSELPRGHRSFLRVLDLDGRSAMQRLLSREGARTQLSLPKGPAATPWLFVLLSLLPAVLLGVGILARSRGSSSSGSRWWRAGRWSS
jgi:hypothetical protein